MHDDVRKTVAMAGPVVVWQILLAVRHENSPNCSSSLDHSELTQGVGNRIEDHDQRQRSDEEYVGHGSAHGN